MNLEIGYIMKLENKLGFKIMNDQEYKKIDEDFGIFVSELLTDEQQNELWGDDKLKDKFYQLRNKLVDLVDEVVKKKEIIIIN